MQPSPMADTCRLLLPSLRFCMVFRLCGAMGFTRGDFDRCGAGPGPDHGAEVRAVTVLRLVGLVDAVVDRPVDRLERDFFCQAGGRDPPRFLTHRGLVPA